MVETKPFEILLVEDNVDHAELVRRSLSGHQINNNLHHVFDGESALDYLWQRGSFSDRQKNPRPHVILLDLRLPRIDGLEVLRTIKKDAELRHIPVVVLTTSDADADVASAYDNFVNSYLVKPIDFTQFIKLMNDLGFYWLQWNHRPKS